MKSWRGRAPDDRLQRPALRAAGFAEEDLPASDYCPVFLEVPGKS